MPTMVVAVGTLAGAEAHPAPTWEWVCGFRDERGLPLSGLTATLEREGRSEEAEIREGQAALSLQHLEGAGGDARLRVFDPWRRPVFFRDSAGALRSESSFRLIQPDSAWSFPGGEGGRPTPTHRSMVSSFVLAWSADTVASGLREELARAEAIDRAIACELEKRLVELRQRKRVR